MWMAKQTEPVKRLVACKLIKPGMDSRHNPLNEMKDSVLPLATPANSQLWPTNSGQLARVRIVVNQLMPLFWKDIFNSGQIHPTHQPLAKVRKAR